MELSALERRCRRRLKEVFIPRPFDLTKLCVELARRRGRPLIVAPMEFPSPGPGGLWIAGDTTDYIFHEQATSRFHQEHIVLHEIGHMICRHEASRSRPDPRGAQGPPGPPQPPAMDAAHARVLFPHLDPAVVGRLLARTRYSTEEEREAEMIASLILQQAEWAPARELPTDPATRSGLMRFERGVDSPRSPAHG
ncbi:hypothetical protein [Rhizohabitans arisaemae]|uniref:hypothetical protein n=1 Tax=Rhizohabitans arisaemae TaxID=2720610 RepID=UPI0024B0F220|nr:hypothetical protein [Rhizohabitans arisaemae]